MIKVEYKSCGDCLYEHRGCDENPCKQCRNNRCVDDPMYSITPLLWRSNTEGGVQTDAVSHPSHYNQGGIECIDAMVSAFGKEAVENFCLVNAFKYVWRSREKNGFEDIDKAIWYLNKLKELSAVD